MAEATQATLIGRITRVLEEKTNYRRRHGPDDRGFSFRPSDDGRSVAVFYVHGQDKSAEAYSQAFVDRARPVLAAKFTAGKVSAFERGSRQGLTVAL